MHSFIEKFEQFINETNFRISSQKYQGELESEKTFYMFSEMQTISERYTYTTHGEKSALSMRAWDTIELCSLLNIALDPQCQCDNLMEIRSHLNYITNWKK